ncbi:NmrA family protein (macronuclear) [Tetrahymena thermophila SB210]|uniref:NmrA family protein n=1 Tax=Tetrahymena thermophila (strain SB210) TaxID=312017 RepID=W7X2W5_TETTS|nr:NmrA family protein [Tetrahymena thermophila SB210]EWS73655.1 NmrA family protein [Tetrahymena thermophila SB210]|eukprot:XP_012653785.1 NmrA family protein [Tetrahymena thermophila SB210]
MSQYKIIILGATGLVGQATVKALVKQKIAVTAGVRDISKAKELMAYGAKVIQANMGFDQQKLANILSKFDVLFIVTPGHTDRINLTINTINAAKQANVKYIVMVSDTSAHNYDTIFGKQFGTIEQYIKQSGLSYCILRLPIFIDNLWGSAESIKYQNTFYGPIDGNKKYITVAVQDAALAAASVLTHPFNHVGKTYTIYSDYKSSNELASLYSLALGRPIQYKNIMYEGTKQVLLKQMPEWYVEGYLELFKLVEKQDLSQILCSYDFKNLTNQSPTTHLNWMWQNFKYF